VLLLDLHSFGAGLEGDVILGDRNGATATPKAVKQVAAAFIGAGLDVRMNQRFSGGWTVRRFARNPNVDAVQVELNQRRYLDLDNHRFPGVPPRREFDATQRTLLAALTTIVTPG
jgi:N-formylglutamate amidohydrolase